jgi:hypothetical protein
MKRPMVFVMIALATAFFLIWLLNIKVSVYKGIDYQVHTIKMPLYLKMLDFYDRHYNYMWLAGGITKGKAGQADKVEAVFLWVRQNLIFQPQSLRAIDDHAWNIIIRGYATRDQFSDVFTTLCRYAGLKAFFLKDDYRHYFSFVSIDGQWYVFDPVNAARFSGPDGSMLAVSSFAHKPWCVFDAQGKRRYELEEEYRRHVEELGKLDLDKRFRWSKANIQSPLTRMLYGIKVWAQR